MAKAKKTKGIKLKIWWLFIPVLVAISIFIYGLFQNKTPQPEESSRYVTYKDSDFGLSIEYPQNWEVKKDTQIFENGDAVAFQIKGPTQKRYTEFIDGARFIISKPFTINTDLEIWVKENFKDASEFSKLTLGKYSFEKVYNCSNLGCMTYYFTLIRGISYGIGVFAEGTSTDKMVYENAISHMLKSVKFPVIIDEIIPEDEAILVIKELSEVKDYLKRVPNALVSVNGEKDDEYMIQVYEIKNGHTATFSWYRFNKKTGKITKEL